MASILITGANGNLGITVVNQLLRENFNIIAVAGPSGAGELQESDRLNVMKADLLDEEKAHTFISNTIKEHPDLYGAVLLVGGFAMGRLVETGKAGLNRMIDLNFYSAYHIVRPLLSYFPSRPEGGHFVLIGSRPGLNAADGKAFFAYSLSKAMIFKLAEFINAEGKGKRVSATVIVPSTIDTEANRQAMPDADFSTWVPPGNIAEAISFALSGTGRMTQDHIIKIYNKA